MEQKRLKGLDEKFCNDCGTAIKIKAMICPHCGVRQKSISVKSKTTAAVLAFFLGVIGAHKFYLGKTILGIAYLFFFLFFFWTFLPLFIVLIDLIILLCMSQDKFEEKYY
ncbi:MAG TPA: TM2 domain-containing protein [Patescibacteria group bacterium]|nr:TM2 domain-containing protein [Patescibacteria group bacterium]